MRYNEDGPRGCFFGEVEIGIREYYRGRGFEDGELYQLRRLD